MRNRERMTLLCNERRIWERFMRVCQAFWFLGIQSAVGHFVIFKMKKCLNYFVCRNEMGNKWRVSHRIFQLQFCIILLAWEPKKIMNESTQIDWRLFVNWLRSSECYQSNQSQGISNLHFRSVYLLLKFQFDGVLTWCQRSAWCPAFYQELFLVWNFLPILWCPFFYTVHDNIS